MLHADYTLRKRPMDRILRAPKAGPHPPAPATLGLWTWRDARKRAICPLPLRGPVPKLEAIDRRAVVRAARGLAPMMRRRAGYFGLGRADALERSIKRIIEDRLEAIEDDDLPPSDVEDLLWARVERSGLVLVGIGERAYIVARTAPRGGRAARLLVR